MKTSVTKLDSISRTLCCLILTSTLLAGCGGQQVAIEQTLPVGAQGALTTLNQSQQKQRDLAVSATEKLFQSLLGELTASIGENGVAKSIEVCKTKAPALAQSVSVEFGLRIGRTSFQLRNAASRPPKWAATFVKDRVEKEVNVDIGEERLGVLLPIRLKNTCVKCHGQIDTIGGAVRSAIQNHYPSDDATGFAEGDLRGYFWVEVPKGDEA